MVGLEAYLDGHVIDVVIPCHSRDCQTLDLAIAGIRKHGKDIRRIIVVSDKLLSNNAEFFDEKRYPFSLHDVALAIFRGDENRASAYVSTANNKLGWVYQQLLKLYTPIVIPDISDNVLMLDADTIFLRKVSFIDDDGYALYNTGKSIHTPYFHHAKRLLPHFSQIFPGVSGICHHMLMQRPVIQDLFNEIKKYHAQEPWQALCHCIDVKELPGSCLSEYEIYFNYAFSHAYKVKLRPLKWRNFHSHNNSQLPSFKETHYDYVSCHLWRTKKKKA